MNEEELSDELEMGIYPVMRYCTTCGEQFPSICGMQVCSECGQKAQQKHERIERLDDWAKLMLVELVRKSPCSSETKCAELAYKHAWAMEVARSVELAKIEKEQTK